VIGATFRPTEVEIDLGAIRHNVGMLRPAEAQLMAVVKADAYGHGAASVAREALVAGATWCGVALVEEGVELRGAGIEAPILLLSEFPPGSEAVALAHRLTPTVYSRGGVRRLADAAHGSVGVHVKVDTGMHRVGAAPEAARHLAELIASSDELELEGLWTHLAASEDPAHDDYTAAQLDAFETVRAELRAAGIEPPIVHAANSGGDQPDVGDSSVCTKSSPYSGWSFFSMRPYMCVPHALHA